MEISNCEFMPTELNERFLQLYIDTSTNPMPSVLYGYPESMKDYFTMLYNANNQECPKLEDCVELNPIKVNNINEKKVMVAFSGGKDSTATVLYLLDKGYEVVLYNVIGLNKSYPKELDAVEYFANKYNLEIIYDRISKTGKTEFFENPMKNHLILSGMISYGVSRGIINYSLGSFTSDILSDMNILYNFSDTYEFYREYEKWIKNYFPEFNLMLWWGSETDSITYLCRKHSDDLPYTQSCMMPLRYRYKLKRDNEEKYGIELMPERCGSCLKCCLEYILFAIHNVVKPNKDYIKKCLQILRKHWKEEQPQMEYEENHYTDAEILEEYIHTSKIKESIERYGK